ncbi:MAG: hypothetical protein ACKE8G_02505 [Methylophagaceae bacterium]
MQRLRWILTRWYENIGLAGCCAWLLLISLLLYGFYIFLPKYKHYLMLDKTAVPAAQRQQVVQAYLSPAEPIFTQMPHIKNTPASIQSVFDTAELYGLNIDEIIYKDEKKRGDSVIRYTMSFSVESSYLDIKAFIVHVLAELPLLALEQLSFERSANQDDIAAHLRFTLYMVN